MHHPGSTRVRALLRTRRREEAEEEAVAGCTTASCCKGLCGKHGGGKEECKIAGCSNRIYGFLKACQKHGGSGYCQHPSGCIAPATKYGAYCKKHTKKEMMD